MFRSSGPTQNKHNDIFCKLLVFIFFVLVFLILLVFCLFCFSFLSFVVGGQCMCSFFHVLFLSRERENNIKFVSSEVGRV